MAEILTKKNFIGKWNINLRVLFKVISQNPLEFCDLFYTTYSSLHIRVFAVQLRHLAQAAGAVE